MKFTWVQDFRDIDYCIWPPGGLELSKNYLVHNLLTYRITNLSKVMKSTSVQNFREIDSSIWPPGSSNCQEIKKSMKNKILFFLFIIHLHNELQTCRKS